MARTKHSTVPVCAWTPDESVWETGCGQSFQFMECDGPKANGMKFCCYCGLPLRHGAASLRWEALKVGVNDIHADWVAVHSVAPLAVANVMTLIAKLEREP